MKNLIIVIFSLILSTSLFAAGSDSSSSSSSETSLYEDAVKLVKRAGKLEKKEKTEKAKKLYSQAFGKLEKAHKSDKKNPDILNYNERLEVLKSCNCKEYGELELIIKTRGSKVY